MGKAEWNASHRARGLVEVEADEARWIDRGCPDEYVSVIVSATGSIHEELTDCGHWVYVLRNMEGNPLSYAGQTGAGIGCESLRQRMYDHRKLETVGPGSFWVTATRHRLGDLAIEEGKAILRITQLYCDEQSWFRPTNADQVTKKLLARHDARQGPARATPLDARSELPQIEMWDE